MSDQMADMPLAADAESARAGAGGRTFSALRNPDFRLYWGTQLLSLAGSWMQVTAQSWLVYRLTGSPLALGFTWFVPLLPVVPISLLGGALADRVSRRNLVIVTQIGLLLQAIILTILTATGQIQVWHIFLLEFVLGAVGAVDQPSRQALLAEIVGREELLNAVALNAAAYNAARVVGPALAGVIVALIGEAGCFAVNAVSFTLVIVALALIRIRYPSARDLTSSLTGGVIAGIRYLWGQPLLVGLIGLVTVSSLISVPYVVIPIFASDVLHVGPTELGFLMAMVGGGAVLGGLLAASLAAGQRGRILLGAAVAFGAVQIAFALSRSYVFSLAFLVGAGGSFVLLQALTNALLQLFAPDELRGRVLSIYNLSAIGTQRFGGLLIGAGAAALGAPRALFIATLVCLLCVAGLAWRVPGLRSIR